MAIAGCTTEIDFNNKKNKKCKNIRLLYMFCSDKFKLNIESKKNSFIYLHVCTCRCKSMIEVNLNNGKND